METLYAENRRRKPAALGRDGRLRFTPERIPAALGGAGRAGCQLRRFTPEGLIVL
jgi:hypothetical protein